MLGSVLEAGHVVSAFLELSPCWDPEDRAGLLIKKKKEKKKKKPGNASFSRQEEWQGVPAAINLCFGLTHASPQPCWPSDAIERLISCTFATSSWNTRPL